MDTNIWLSIIGILATLFGFFLIRNVIKNRKLQKNKIVIKSKGDSAFRDIVGGDKITNADTESHR